MCDIGALLARIHYDGSHSACVETRDGQSFSLERDHTATEHKQHATKSQADALYCGLMAGKA